MQAEQIRHDAGCRRQGRSIAVHHVKFREVAIRCSALPATGVFDDASYTNLQGGLRSIGEKKLHSYIIGVFFPHAAPILVHVSFPDTFSMRPDMILPWLVGKPVSVSLDRFV